MNVKNAGSSCRTLPLPQKPASGTASTGSVTIAGDPIDPGGGNGGLHNELPAPASTSAPRQGPLRASDLAQVVEANMSGR